MTTFDKREEGFENKFAHDEELRFKAGARRNKLLGLWAAEKMGLSGPAADTYAKEVVVADFEEAGDEDVFRKVRKDFDAKGVVQSDQDIRKAMIDLMGRAIDQIKTGNYNLDLKNPHNSDTGPGDVDHLLQEYEKLLAQIVETRAALKHELHRALTASAGTAE